MPYTTLHPIASAIRDTDRKVAVLSSSLASSSNTDERRTRIFAAISFTGIRSACRTARNNPFVTSSRIPARRKGCISKSRLLRTNLRSTSLIASFHSPTPASTLLKTSQIIGKSAQK